MHNGSKFASHKINKHEHVVPMSHGVVDVTTPTTMKFEATK